MICKVEWWSLCWFNGLRTFPGKTFPGQSFSQKEVYRVRRFLYSHLPGMTFPGKHAQVIKKWQQAYDSSYIAANLIYMVGVDIYQCFVFTKYLPFKHYFVKVLWILISVGLGRWRWRVDWLKSAHLHAISAASCAVGTDLPELSRVGDANWRFHKRPPCCTEHVSAASRRLHGMQLRRFVLAQRLTASN